MIKSEALLLVQNCNDNGETLEVTYKSTLESKNILSLKFDANVDNKISPHPTAKLYTLNLDINTCTKLKLEDFVNIDEKLVDKFKVSKADESVETGVAEKAIKYLLESPNHTTDYFITTFKGADSSYEADPFTFSYLTKDAIVISTEVPHSAGDHVEIDLKYDDIKNSINYNNVIWNY